MRNGIIRSTLARGTAAGEATPGGVKRGGVDTSSFNCSGAESDECERVMLRVVAGELRLQAVESAIAAARSRVKELEVRHGVD